MQRQRRPVPLLCGQIHFSTADAGDDEATAALAKRQHGVVTRRQLLLLGVGSRSIEHRVRCGRLRVIHEGVYAVGHEALGYAAKVLAAVWAVRGMRGASAAASHHDAAALWKLWEPNFGPVHVTAEVRRRPRRGIETHRGRLPAAELTTIEGIPVTSVARNLLDLAAVLSEDRVRRLTKEAEFRRTVTIGELAAILDRYPNRRGRRKLVAIVDRLAPSLRSRSELEDRFHEFLLERNLPLPETNVLIDVGADSLEVDCVWRVARLIVELDGHEAHTTASGFERDRARDRALIATS